MFLIETTPRQRSMAFAVGLCKFYARRKVFRRKTPLLASFKLTYRCNLTCRACPFHRKAKEEKAHMDWDTAVRSLAELKRRGTQIVVFEGGEPLLWKEGHRDLKDLIHFAKALFPRVAITTNGTLPLSVPADIIWVSLDGLEETHNRLRSGSFDHVWSNLGNASHRTILVHVTLNRENWRDLEALLEKLRDVTAVRGVTIQLFYPYGQGEEMLSLSHEDRKDAIENVIRLKRRGFPILNAVRSLRAMVRNDWACHGDVLINVDPDGVVSEGCYAGRRGNVSCKDCGFTPVAEASGAVDLIPASLIAGWRIFFRN